MRLIRSRLARLSLATLFPISTMLGCAHTAEKQFARYEPGNEKLMSTVPMTGVYSVRWTRKKADGLRDLDGTQMLLYKGESAGFETQDDGTVVAVGGARRIVLDRLPDNARYTIWYHKSKQQTHFGREFDKALETTGRIAAATAIVAGGAVLIGVGIYAAAHADHDDQYNGYRR